MRHFVIAKSAEILQLDFEKSPFVVLSFNRAQQLEYPSSFAHLAPQWETLHVLLCPPPKDTNKHVEKYQKKCSKTKQNDKKGNVTSGRRSVLREGERERERKYSNNSTWVPFESLC